MPILEIGPFTADVKDEKANSSESVRFLRIAFYSSIAQPLSFDDTTRGDVIEKVAALLKHAEDRLTDLLLGFRQGEVGFEEADGKLIRVTFKYPEFERVKGSNLKS